MIKIFVIFNLVFILSINLNLAFGKNQSDSAKKSDNNNIGYATLAPEMETLINQSSFLKKRYESCIKTKPNEVSTCMTEGLDDAQLSQIADKLKEIKKKKREKLGLDPLPSTTKSKKGSSKVRSLQYEGKDLISTTTKNDKALQALEKYMYQKLQKAISQSLGGDNKVNYSHGIYFKLYQSQLGKNIISSYSSYCLDANNYFKIEKSKIKKNRKANFKRLKENEETAKDHFLNCISKIQGICYSTGNAYKKLSKQRACQVISQVKAARQMLIANKKISKAFDDKLGLNGSNQTGSNLDIEKTTTLTSNELNDKKNKYASEVEAQQKLAEKCTQNSSSKECDKLINNHDSEQLAISQYAINSELQKKKLNKLDKGNNLYDYLKEQDYTDKQISAMTKDKAATDALIKNIRKRYDTEKTNLIAAMNEKLNNQTVNKAPGQDINAQRTKIMTSTKKELASKVNNYKENIYFTNVVSSYLTVVGADKKERTNTYGLQAELKNSAFDKSKSQTGTDPASSSEMQANFNAIKSKVKSGSKKSSNKLENTQLGVSTINEKLLQYDNQPEFIKSK